MTKGGKARPASPAQAPNPGFAALLQLGPESERLLSEIGVLNVEQLEELGAVGAYVAAYRKGLKPTLSLLYALEGAIRGMHWASLPYQVKASLTLEADAMLAADESR